MLSHREAHSTTETPLCLKRWRAMGTIPENVQLPDAAGCYFEQINAFDCRCGHEHPCRSLDEVRNLHV
jgi:hypothetical protein